MSETMMARMQDVHGRITQMRQEMSRLTPEQFREREYERLKKLADERNAQPGDLNQADEIECSKCLNRGYAMVVLYDGKSLPTLELRYCECAKARQFAKRLRASGLHRAVKRYTFDSFEVKDHWQQVMFEKAKRYIRKGSKDGRWFYVGGQSGAGKTHICTAIANDLMKDGDLLYVVWPQAAKLIGGAMKDTERYDAEVERLQTARFLYVDDFFKPVFRANGMEAMATATDVRLAYDILNYRYLAELPTIISSEWFSHELAAIDEATAGRIAEACGEYKVDIARDSTRNHRLRNEVI